LYDRLLATMQNLDVNKEINPESVTIMEKASPAYPERPALVKKLVIGGLAGVGCAILLLLFLDRLDDRMNSFTELQELFDETVLGQIPRGQSVGGEIEWFSRTTRDRVVEPTVTAFFAAV
jgi:capsular polysaccharide biosynthesis protein